MAETPRRPMDAWDDPELAELFAGEPDLYELSRSLKASRPEPVSGPHFEPYLRARLMDAAARELRPRGLSRWLRPRPGVLAGGGAALGLAMIGAVVAAVVLYQPHDSRVNFSTNVAENHDVSPDDVIRVSFTQAVDHGAVEQNLQIHPATAVQTHWEGTTLVITPLHRLAANTPYTVTIPRTAVRAANGDVVAQSDIRIAFGTKSTPSPGPTQPPVSPPALQVVALGPVAPGSAVVLGPDGSVVATAGLVAPSASPSPAALSSVVPTGLPGVPTATGSPSSTASPSTSASPSPSPAPALARLSSSSSAVALGPAAAGAAFSPSGASLAYVVNHGGTADLWVARADGSHAVRLVRNADAGSPLAWSGEDSLVYLSGGGVSTVDLQGRSRPVGGNVHVAPGEDAALAPGGSLVYLGPLSSTSASPPASASPSPSPSAVPAPTSDQGVLIDLGSGNARALHGIKHPPAFSADGSHVAWVDESGSAPLLEVSRTAADGTSPSTVSTAAASGDSLGNVALSGDGSRVVYTLSHGPAAPNVRVVSVASGDTVAVGDGQPVLSPSLSATGDRMAFLRPGADGSTQAAVATVPGVPAVTPAPDAVPSAASSVLGVFVTAQLNNDLPTLRNLGTADLTVTAALTPGGLTRSYVIKAAMAPDTGQVAAQVRFVRDASHDAATTFADESLVLQRGADGTYKVSSAALSDFQSEPNGPQIVHVSSERQASSLVVRIAFDSDLDPATVTASAISLSDAQGTTLGAVVTYEMESRTAVVRLDNAPAGTLTLAVSGALHDISGQALPSSYSTSLQS